MLHNSFSLKHLSGTTDNFLTYCGQSLAGLSVHRSKILDIKKKSSENFIEYFSLSKNGMTKCMST